MPDLPDRPDLPDLPAPTATPSTDAQPSPAAVADPGESAADAGAADVAAQPDPTDPPTEPVAPQAADAPPAATLPVDTPPAVAPGMSPSQCADALKQHFPALFGAGAKPLKLRIQADIQQRAPGVFSKGVMSAFFRRYTGSTSYLIALSKASERFDLDGQPAGELSEEHRQLARAELDRRRQLVREREQQARAAQRGQTQQPQQPLADGAETQTGGAAAPANDRRPPRPPRARPDPPEPRRGRGAEQAQNAGPAREPRPRPERRPAPQPGPEQAQTDRPPRPARSEAAVAGDGLPAVVAESPEALQARQERETRRALLRDFDRSPLTLANFCVLKGLKPEALTPLLEQARKEMAADPAPRPPAAEQQRRPDGPRRDDRRDGRPGDRRPGRPGERSDARRPRGPGGQS